MGAMTQSEIVEFFGRLNAEKDRKDTRNFCDFLDLLFHEREFEGCTFFTSLYTFCIVRFPTPREWRFAPLLSLRIASSANVLIELRLTTATKPALRAVTESSNAKYDIALQEFARMYERFLEVHEE